MGHRSFGDVLLFVVSISKEWDIDLMGSSLCLVFRFPKNGIYILWVRLFVCCFVFQKMGYRSYGFVLVFGVSFSKEWDIDLMGSPFCLLFRFPKIGI